MAPASNLLATLHRCPLPPPPARPPAGDTPKGMVESAFEFADICRDLDFHNFLFSMKASNPLVMVQVGPGFSFIMLGGSFHGGLAEYVWPLLEGLQPAGHGAGGLIVMASLGISCNSRANLGKASNPLVMVQVGGPLLLVIRCS